MRRLAARAHALFDKSPGERLAELVRDIDTLLGRRRAPPVIRSSPPRLATAPSSRWLTVREVIRETADAVSLVFAPDLEPWRAGQFLTVHVPTAQGTLRRAYSLCTVASDPRGPAIAVKRIPGGRASTHLVEHARPGMRLEVRGPSGQFTLPERVGAAPRSLLLVGGGSGITPLIALAEEALASGDEVAFLYGNRAREDIIFAARLEGLTVASRGRLRVRHVLERPPSDWHGGVGRLDPATALAELGALTTRPPDVVMSCGPEPMMAAVRDACRALALADRLREERFISLGEQRARELPTTPQRLRYHLGGRVHEVLARPGTTLLEAGLAAGLAMPSSCTMGGCGACRVRARGELVHDTPNALDADEQAAGYAFACIARPLGPCDIEVGEPS